MFRRWTVACALALAGCGRIGFDGFGPAVRSTLTIETEGGPLVDFPLLVVLDDTRADRASMQPDASDLQFSQAGTALAFELVQVGAAGGSPTLAIVRVPTLANGTQVDVHYGGDPVAATGSAWSSEFAGVWHFEDATMRDATTNRLDGTANGTQPAPGVLGNARSFDVATKDFIRVADSPALELPTFTISAWVSLRSTGLSFTGLVTRQVTNTDFSDFLLSVRVATPVAQVSTGAIDDAGDLAPDPIPLATWVHLATTFDGAEVRLFVDGNLVQTTPATGTTKHSAQPVFFGAECTDVCTDANADFFDGMIDEIRIERGARPDAWIRADALSQRDQLITYGSVD